MVLDGADKIYTKRKLFIREATLENPEKLQRFRQFVNSDQQDSGVVFVQEREQIRPARVDERLRLVAVAK